MIKCACGGEGGGKRGSREASEPHWHDHSKLWFSRKFASCKLARALAEQRSLWVVPICVKLCSDMCLCDSVYLIWLQHGSHATMQARA